MEGPAEAFQHLFCAWRRLSPRGSPGRRQRINIRLLVQGSKALARDGIFARRPLSTVAIFPRAHRANQKTQTPAKPANETRSTTRPSLVISPARPAIRPAALVAPSFRAKCPVPLVLREAPGHAARNLSSM